MFECKRFEKSYTDVKLHHEWAESAANVCQPTVFEKDNGKPFLNSEDYDLKEKINVLLATAYTAVNAEKEQIYILKYKRIISEFFQTSFQIFFDCVVKSFPLEKNFKCWFEKNPTENDPYLTETSNPMRVTDHFKKHKSSDYNFKKRIFVEGLRMTYRILQYEAYANLMREDFFLIKESEKKFCCTYSVLKLFLLLLEYSTDWRYLRKQKEFEREPPQKLKKNLCDFPISLYVPQFLLQVFVFPEEVPPFMTDWRTLREYLPHEMFILSSRLVDGPKILQGNRLKILLSELEYGYKESKIECYERLTVKDNERVPGLLGCGGFGDVFLAQHKGSKQKYAIKVIKNYNLKSENEVKRLLETVLRLSQFDNQHVVKHYDAWTSKNHYNWISENTEYDSVTTLTDSKESLTKSQFCTAREYPEQETYGYTFIVLEPQNALINRTGNLIISDLDTLKRIKDNATEETTPKTLVQTPAYVSPEMLTKIYNERTDYFSAGITFAQMIYPEESKNMKKFLELIHAEQLPAIMHPQYAFVIRWLTEKDQKNRIGFLSFKILLSLLQKHQYKNWLLRVCSSYFVLVENTRIGESMKCIRVVNRNSTIREIVRRYSRRPDSFVMKTKIRLRIEPKFAFENHYNFKFNDTSQKAIDLQDNSLMLVNVEDDYVYICYYFEEYKEESTSAAKLDSWVQSMLAIFLETMTTWGNYSCATINRAHFRKNHFVIEPSLLDNGSNDDIPSGITLFWAPEKFNNAEPMTESAAIYSFGLFILWNLLRNLDVTENDRMNFIMELRNGNKPLLLPYGIQPHLSQLILLICAFNPQMRPSLQNLSHELISITRPCVVDELFPFRLCLAFDQEKDLREAGESSDPDDCSNKQYNPRRKLNEYIYTISNRNGVVEKFFNKLKICGRFKILPRLLATERRSNKVTAKCMLDFAENGLLVAVPRSTDAVDWIIIEHGDSYPEIRLNILAIREFEFSYIHSTFAAAMKELAKYHREGLCHGNINLNTFLLSNNGNFCISNPILIEEDNELFDRKAYITEYSAPEQFCDGIASVHSDIYSLGVTLYSCLCYYYIQTIGNVEDIFRKEDKTCLSDKIPLEFIYLITDMTALEPKRRIDCETALERFLIVCGPHLAEIQVPPKRIVIYYVIKDDDQLEIAK